MATRVTIVVYLLGEWEHFHRRPMLEALARAGLGYVTLLLVAPPKSVRHLTKRRWGVPRGFGLPSLRRIGPNLFLARPYIWLPLAGRRGRESGLWRALVKNQVRWAVAHVRETDEPVVAWIYRPDQDHNLGMADERFVVYECFDEYRLNYWDSSPMPSLAEKEGPILDRADLVFATARSLMEVRRKDGVKIEYAPNGVDYRIFARASAPDTTIPDELDSLPKPRIGYLGNISAALDLQLLEALARSNPDWSFVLIGPVDRTAEEMLGGLHACANVHLLGRKRREALAGYLKGLDVGLIPYRRNEVNRHRNPLKLWEYLAAGLPVVATPLFELDGLGDLVWVGEGVGGFELAITAAMRDHTGVRKGRGRELARDHSWERLTSRMLHAVHSMLRAPRVEPGAQQREWHGTDLPRRRSRTQKELGGHTDSVSTVPWPYIIEPARPTGVFSTSGRDELDG